LFKVAGISSDGFLEAFRNARSARGAERRRAEEERDRHRAATRPSLPPTEAMTSPLGDDLPAELANHSDYKILRELGRGGMGVVYLAHNQLMGRDEVLKVMGSHIIARAGVMERFLGEIRAVAGLRHENIVTAYTAFRSGESLVFAMEYVEGLDLARMVKARGPMPVANACSYVRQAALGLQHAHERGLVHRDIKPGNLMLSRHGARALIKVLDFGLAKAGRENKVVPLGLGDAQPMGPGATLTLAGQMLGTPDFIAPEQIDDARGADIRADIYSLGCTLYYLLAGGPPFQGATLYDILQAHHSMDAQLLNFVRPEVPSELAALVAKMMAKEPKRRFQTPDEVAKALSPFFKRSQAAFAPSFRLSRVDAPATDLSTAGSTQVTPDSAPAPAPAPAATPLATRNQDRPEEMWKSLINFTEPEEPRAAPALATRPVRKHPRWFWPAVAGLVGFLAILLVAVITYRIATDKGVLVIETEDPNIKVIVKQGGKRVTIIDPQTNKQIDLQSGKYELGARSQLGIA
jgi:serine/threonine protein kinase